MNRERARRREEIAVAMMAAISGAGQYHTFANQAHDAVGMAEALMAKLDEAALADFPNANSTANWECPDSDGELINSITTVPGGAIPDRGDGWLNAITEAQCETLRRSVDAFFDNVAQARKEHRDYTWSQFQAELNELRKVAKRDRDALGDKYIEIAALNGIVKVREDQVADLERKVAALNEFAEAVRAEAHEDPELYGPFVRLVRDLDAKVGAK